MTRRLSMPKHPEPVVHDLYVLRVSKRMTQAQVAAEMGISNRTLCWYEIGRRKPPLHRIRVWAKALGMELKIIPASG